MAGPGPAPSRPVSRAAFYRDWVLLTAAAGLCVRWVVLHAQGTEHLSVTAETIWPGLAILGAAALLSWAAELAQLEITQALAIVFLALVAVLPEYAVDMYLAWTAGKHPAYTAFAMANMTGANRLLIGLGWSTVLFVYWLRTRKPAIAVAPTQRLELLTLLAATAYAFIIPLKRTVSVVDTVFFLALFIWYIRKASQGHVEEPGLAGPAERLAVLPRTWRRVVTVALFLLPAYTIFISAEPFADGLLKSARHLGVDEFILIQWLAPLASESPEFILAIIFALRSNPTAGLGTLVSSKVNQWTLLVGLLPLVYSMSAGHLEPMHLDARQVEELFLTAAQSLLAITVLANLSFGLGEAVLLIALFFAQFLFPSAEVRLWLAWGYVALAAAFLISRNHRRALVALVREGWR